MQGLQDWKDWRTDCWGPDTPLAGSLANLWFIYYSQKCRTPDFQKYICFPDVWATKPVFLRFPAKPRELSILTFHDGSGSGLCLARNTWCSDVLVFKNRFCKPKSSNMLAIISPTSFEPKIKICSRDVHNGTLDKSYGAENPAFTIFLASPLIPRRHGAPTRPQAEIFIFWKEGICELKL